MRRQEQRLLKRLKIGIVAGHHDEVLSTTSMDVVLLCGLRRLFVKHTKGVGIRGKIGRILNDIV